MDGTLKVELVYSQYGIESKRLSRGMLGLVLVAHAGLLLLIFQHQEQPQPVERPILISLIAPEASAEKKVEIAPEIKPQPVEPVPAKKVQKVNVPQKPAVTTEPEPRLVTQAAESTPVFAPEPKTSAPVVETATQLQPEPVKAAEPAPRAVPIEQPSFNADYLDNPSPAYPALSRKLREEGRVLLRVRVDVHGQPAQVTLHESSGHARLDERAADTVRRWKFVPARNGGQPVEAWVIVPIQFSLKG